MKKFFKKHGKEIFLFAAITAAAIVAYIIAHKIATFERKYEAIGGEIFVPLLIVFAPRFWEIFKEPFKAVKKNVSHK